MEVINMLYVGEPLRDLPDNFTGIGIKITEHNFEYFEASNQSINFDKGIHKIDKHKYHRISAYFQEYSRYQPEFRIYKNGQMVNRIVFDRTDRSFTNMRMAALVHFMCMAINKYDNIAYYGHTDYYNTHVYVDDDKTIETTGDALSDESVFVAFSNKICRNWIYYNDIIVSGFISSDDEHIYVLTDTGLYNLYDTEHSIKSTMLSNEEVKHAIINNWLTTRSSGFYVQTR